MVDTKFLIVTTLCYVGILIVVLAVCCCAWARYMKNEGKMPPNRRTKHTHRANRRAAREPNEHCLQPPPPRQYRYIGEFTDLNYPHQPTSYPHLQHNFRAAGSMPRPSYSSNTRSNHYTLVADGYHPPRNFYPASLATDTYDLRMDITSAAYADTSQGGFSGDDFSDFQSSRYDSGHDVSGIISGDGAALSCSDAGNSLKIANNNSVDTNECDQSTDILTRDDYTRQITVDIEGSIQSDYPTDPAESLLVTSMTEECCNGGGLTPSPSAQSLTEFNDQPEEIPLNAN